MTDHITQINESSCEFIESIDTKATGLIEVSRQLVGGASKVVTEYNNGEYDPVFVGEMLLLAGFSSLLASQDCKPTNFAVHFDGLKVQGKDLPVQSIYIAMKEAHPTVVKKSSPRTTIHSKEDSLPASDEEIQKASEQIGQATMDGLEDAMQVAEQEHVNQPINYALIQAKLDAETPDEIMEMVREQELGARRFAGQPSVADEPLPENLGVANHNPSRSLKLPFYSGGLHGGRE